MKEIDSTLISPTPNPSSSSSDAPGTSPPPTNNNNNNNSSLIASPLPPTQSPALQDVVAAQTLPHHLVTLCDTLLNRIDLMLQLLFSASDIVVSLSLSGLADSLKIRQIRDKLIEQDRLELAQVVATKCGIEIEPILAAKGLQMLQAGKYQEAKQLFRMCLFSASPDDAPAQRTSSIHGTANGLLLLSSCLTS